MIEWNLVEEIMFDADSTEEELESVKGCRILQVSLFAHDEKEYFTANFYDDSEENPITIAHARYLGSISPLEGSIHLRLDNGVHLYGVGIHVSIERKGLQ